MDSRYYLTTSPRQLVAGKRVADADGLRSLINNATVSLCLEVMDYAPLTLFQTPMYYWGVLDDAFRAASMRKVNVRLIFAVWNNTRPELLQYWRSLYVYPG